MKWLILIVFVIISCTSTKNAKISALVNNHYDSLQKKLIFVKEPIAVKVTSFIKDGNTCAAGGSFTYAFITASALIDTNKQYNIFAICYSKDL
jgi:hypothetical protein